MTTLRFLPFDYSFLDGIDIVSGMNSNSGFAWTRSYEPNRPLITAVTNSISGSLISAFEYVNDVAGRCTTRTDYKHAVMTQSNTFGYNIRSEIISSSMGTNTYNYSYDPIGNRTSSSVNEDSTNYISNNLNQYSEISSDQTISPSYDANGNITEYISYNGDVVAHTSYDPFGGMIDTQGDISHYSHWFSTKPRCEYTGLYEYQYRKYNPVIGRWMSRDPMSFYADYIFCINNTLFLFDYFGLLSLPSFVRDELPNWALAIDDIVEFGFGAVSNQSELNLDVDVINLIREDPDIIRLKKTTLFPIVEKSIREFILNHRKNDCIFEVLNIESLNKVELGGKRARGNMMTQALHFWKPEYRDTWRVGVNPLTWMVRHVDVKTNITINLIVCCDIYYAGIEYDHSFVDILDLRPHNKMSFSEKLDLLMSPYKNPYDSITLVLGTIWHDILGRRDDTSVKAAWKSFSFSSGVVK